MSDLSSLEHKLRGLRALATPGDLASNVLLQTGLADRFTTLPTPLGPMYIAWNESGVSFVRPARSPLAFVKMLEAALGRRGVAAPMPNDLRRALQRRFAGEGYVEIAVDLRSRSAFERLVLQRTATIPRGSMKPYAWIAAQIGNPRAVRAVGTALGKNPVPLVIPCHRVIRADGAIGSYVFGGASKARILRVEGALT